MIFIKIDFNFFSDSDDMDVENEVSESNDDEEAGGELEDRQEELDDTSLQEGESLGSNFSCV
jgi:hypothetical protein